MRAILDKKKVLRVLKMHKSGLIDDEAAFVLLEEEGLDEQRFATALVEGIERGIDRVQQRGCL